MGNRRRRRNRTQRFQLRASPTAMLEEAKVIRHLFQAGIVEVWVWNTDHYEVRSAQSLQAWARRKVKRLRGPDADPTTSQMQIYNSGTVLLLIGGRYVRC